MNWLSKKSLRNWESNPMIAELKQNIDLVSAVESSGVELARRGTRHVGLCPFHDEKTPSLFIFPDNHFKCFGCGEHGDVIDFVQKLYGLSFKDSLKHLGIERGRITPKVKEEIQRRKRRTELVKQFNDWLSHYTAHVGTLIIETEELMKAGIPPEDLELYAPLLHGLPVWKYHLGILVEGSEEEQFLLYKDKEAPENGRRQI
jgi:DNA primase